MTSSVQWHVNHPYVYHHHHRNTSMRISINTARVCRQMALPSARLWSTSCCCCYSWHHPFSRPAALPPQQNLYHRTDAVRLTFCHNSLRRLTDNLPALHQAGGEPQQFWRLVRKCCSEPASLFSSGVSQRVSVQAAAPRHLPPWW